MLKCNHCGELSNNEKTPNSGDLSNSVRKYYKTRELKIWQKILQVYWFNPKSWLLDEFIFDNNQITFKVRNGNVISASILDLKVRYQKDNYERIEVYITNGNEKLHFKEIPWMLTDEEWEDVFNILDTVPDISSTKMSKVVGVFRSILSFFK